MRFEAFLDRSARRRLDATDLAGGLPADAACLRARSAPCPLTGYQLVDALGDHVADDPLDWLTDL